jgi:hypothetical protein
VKPWLSYTLIRLGLIAAVLTVLLLLGVEGWIAAIFAALVGLCVAYLFFRPQRDRLISSVMKPEPTTDDDIEDSLADGFDESEDR